MEFSDYQCPFCSRHYREVMPTLVEEYVNTGQLKIVMRENPIGRLGYSFWAEGMNQESGLIVERLRYHFELPDSHMSFVVAHATLDHKHHAECAETIEEFATTPEDREAILYFGVATCHQFYYVLEAMYERYLRETEAQG